MRAIIAHLWIWIQVAWQADMPQTPETTSAIALIVAITSAVATLLGLWWSKGSPARIEEMKAKAALDAVNVARIEEEYKRKIEDIFRERAEDFALQTKRIDALEKHVQECDEKYERAITEAAHAKGMVQVLERNGAKVEQKIETIVAKAADSGINLTGK